MTKTKTQKKRGRSCVFAPFSENEANEGEIADVSQLLENQDVAVDVDMVVETLPDTFRILCKTLKHHNVREPAEILGKSKSYVYDRIAVLRQLLARLKGYLNDQ
jgi:DNA-directed RNA polymerase specialized sigma24 family protein